ncbi:MAG: hydroxymethylbilane synthase [Myxococcales bacterium]|nr:hydroxymethylbilane synthase [Myxococcales bacterium]
MGANGTLRLGTRGSDLALWQAHHIAGRLGGAAAGVELEVIKTTGDRILDVPLQGRLDKGFFTRELEHALLDGRVDFAVHSLKDLPTDMPAGLVLAAVPLRADVSDLLLVHPDSLDPTAPGLPVREGATVGSASLRRQALLAHVRPDLRATLLRGNVPTRLRKCRAGAYGAIVVARAGVARLGLAADGLVAFDLDPHRWLPAAAQGALGIQARSDAVTTLARLAELGDAATTRAVTAERGLLKRIEGGCHSAFGALCEAQVGGFVLRAGTALADGRWVQVEVNGPVDTLVTAAFEALGRTATEPAHSRAHHAETWYLPAQAWA